MPELGDTLTEESGENARRRRPTSSYNYIEPESTDESDGEKSPVVEKSLKSRKPREPKNESLKSKQPKRKPVKFKVRLKRHLTERAKLMDKLKQMTPEILDIIKSVKPTELLDLESNTKRPKCEYPRLCAGCGHAYKTKQSFWNHKQRCTMLPNSRRTTDENGFPLPGVGESRIEYICAHCERRYRKKFNLQEHLRRTCRGKPCTKGRLHCWEDGCNQVFYKYVDLVQHVTLQHGQDLQIQKLQFPNYSAFNSWKTEESNSKFMYARKITGSKSFSNTKYHYFVCQFNHRNDKKNVNRKTNRRKAVNLIVPNYNCPSRIMVKESENAIHVTYISSHNHDLNLNNVRYQPLEKETRNYIKTLLQLGVTPERIKEHLEERSTSSEADSTLATKQQFLTLNRIKRMESKLKAKNRARERELDLEKTKLLTEVTYMPEDDDVHDSYEPDQEPDIPQIQEVSPEMVHHISMPIVSQLPEHGMHLQEVPIHQMLHVTQYTHSTPTVPARSEVEEPVRKAKDEVAKSIDVNLKKLRGLISKASAKDKLADKLSKMIQELSEECAAEEKAKPPKRSPKSTVRRKKTQVQAVEVAQTRHEKSFTPLVNESSDLLKPIFQPFNVNLLCLKSLDNYISNRELQLIKATDENFTVGWLYDSVVDNFIYSISHAYGNVLVADSEMSRFVEHNQRVPDSWHFHNWSEVDTVFIPCNPMSNHWILLVMLIKRAELQVLDPALQYDSLTAACKKYAQSINGWYHALRSFLGVVQCNVVSPPHAKYEDASDCGVFVCLYVFQWLNKRSLMENVDPDVFRKYMYNTIVSNSHPTE